MRALKVRGGGRATGVLLVAGLVVAGGAVAAGAEAPAVVRAPAAVEACSEEAADAGTAAALAQRCDAEVEVLSERTEWATTVAQADGTMRLDVSTEALRTRASGEWVDVDNAVVPVEGGFAVAAPVLPMVFSDGSGDAPLVRLERDGHAVSFDVPFDLPEPTVLGAELTYDEVLPGVDLVITVNADATGFSEVLRVESPEAAADPRLRELTFPVATSDGVEVRPDDGGFVVVDAEGGTVLAGSTPAMWDSSEPAAPVGAPLRAGSEQRRTFAEELVTRADGAADDPDAARTVEPLDGETVAELPAQVTADSVTIEPDAGMLTDPETVWPVYIDPPISGHLSRWAAVRDAGFGTKYNFAGDEGVGRCNRTDMGCKGVFTSRLLWHFDGLQTIGDLDPSEIISGTFAVVGTHSYSCAAQPVTLHAVSGFGSGVAFPGGTYWQPIQTQVIAHRQGCAGQEPRRIEFDATWQGLAVATANTSEMAFGLKADDESTMAGWKRYDSGATVSLTYNQAPSTPTSVRTTAPDSACAVGAGRPSLREAPDLRAALSDPDGGNVSAKFDIVRADNPGHLVWDPPATPAQGSGAEHAVGVPDTLTGGLTYLWRVRGIDERGAVGPIAQCEFRLDTEAPVAPTVGSTPGQAAEYGGPTPTGGVGVPGLFRFGHSTSTDVVAYRYSFDSDALDHQVPVHTPSITWTPTSAGTHTLHVQSLDAAGWASTTVLYRFTVDFPSVSDAWRLDEADGTTARNDGVAGSLPLTVASSVTRGPGALASIGRAPGDRALVFDEAADTAATARPVVRTDGPYSVMAYVRLDRTGATATAVSQDGEQVSGFELGYVTGDSSCPTGTGDCWAFSVPSSDTAGASRVTVRSRVPVTPGSWVQLTGSRTEQNGLELSVCPLERSVPTTTTGPVDPARLRANGTFRLGRGQQAGAAANAWRGAIGEVRTYSSAVTTAQLRVTCSALTFPEPNPPAEPGPRPRNAEGADFDGNGKADVFWSNPVDGLWRVSFNGTTPWVVVNGAGAFTTDQFRFADIDGDGRDDVFFAHPDGRWLVSYGATSLWHLINTAAVPNSQLALADLTGDGKADVFWSDPATGLWYVSDGAATPWRHLNGAPGLPTSAFRFGDVDGDGKDDVFYANQPGGRWIVSYGGATAWQPLAYAAVPNEQLLLGDLTGDGKDDVFWVDPADGLWRYSSGGVEGWRQINGAPGIRTDQLQLADMTGDGKVEVFFANPANGLWLVSDAGTSGWTSVIGAVEAGTQVRVR